MSCHADVVTLKKKCNTSKQQLTHKIKDTKKSWDVLELLEGLVVQTETGVSGQVQLLELGRQVLRQSDLTQLVTAQIHTLMTEEKV